MGWNHKSEKASWWLLFLFPIIGMLCSALFPFMNRSPVLFCILFVALSVLGFIVVWRRAGRNDKQE